MKKESNSMSQGVNSKKNGQHNTGAAQTGATFPNCNIHFMKELSGQVLVSIDEFIANRELIHGTPEEGFRLEDGREVFMACELEGTVFPLDKVADLLLNCILINHEAVSAGVNSDFTVQAYPMLARAYKLYCAIMDLLNPDHKRATLEFMRQFDKELYSFLKVEGTVKYFDNISRRDHEDLENPKFCIGYESIDEDYLADLISLGAFRMLKIIEAEEIDDEMARTTLMFTTCMGYIMVAQLRHMGRKAAIKYAANKLGPGSKSCVEVVFRMLSIDKKA